MKQIAIFLAAALLLMSFAGCAPRKNAEQTDKPSDTIDTLPPSQPETEAPTDPAPEALERAIMEVDERYFSDALFIGDSRTDGLRLYAPIPGADYYCGTSMTIFGIMDSQQTVNGVTGLRNLLSSRSYGKIYLMLGINEAGYDTQSFADQYASVVEQIRAAQPNAIIYLQSILYVSQKHEQDYPVFSTENLKAKNSCIAALADGENVIYLEVNDALNDGTDHLPEEYSGDGVHLKPSYYSLWREYLLDNALVDAAHPWQPKVQTALGQQVKAAVSHVLTGVGSEWQTVVVDPSTGEQITCVQTIGSTGDFMQSVSLIRLFIMADVYSQIQGGALREEDVQADLTAMITENDTAAADRLVALLGGGTPEKGREHVKSYAGSLGFRVGFNRGLGEQSAAYNYVSADTVAGLLTRIAKGECVSPEWDEKMRELLFAVKTEDYSLGYPEGVRKGFLYDETANGVLGTAGIVETNGRMYLVCILANGVNSPDKAKELMTKLHTEICACIAE